MNNRNSMKTLMFLGLVGVVLACVVVPLAGCATYDAGLNLVRAVVDDAEDLGNSVGESVVEYQANK